MAAAYLEQLFGMSGQTAVVIGGTGVLGGALSDALAQAGAFVVVSGTNDDAGVERVVAIKALGGDGIYVSADASSRESLQSLLAETLKLRPRVDMLINCAGVNHASPYAELQDDDWDRVFKVNLTATHLACQIFSTHMVADGQGGSILNIGSVTASLPLSRVIAYSASKAAVINLTQNIARELAPQNVRVNALCPGFFPAEQNRSILDEERVENIMRGTPMNRFGQPEELAGAALLLLSKNAGSYITGATFYVDGGFTSTRF